MCTAGISLCLIWMELNLGSHDWMSITHEICLLECQTIFPMMRTNLLGFCLEKLQKRAVIQLLLMVLALAAFCGVIVQYNVAEWTRLVPKTIPSPNKSSDTYPVQPSKPILILMWDHPWNVVLETPPKGGRIGSCTITYNRAKLEKAEAVVFTFMYAPKSWTHFR